VKVECIEPKNLEIKTCSESQKAGVEARLTCAPYYRPAGDLPIHYEKCGENGKWSPGVHEQFSCVPDCGISEVKRTPYITNGVGTERGQWPWHVGIYLLVDNELQYICGGALITDQSVLTSGHCVVQRTGTIRQADELVVFLGKQQIGLPDVDPFVQRRLVTKVLLEESFNYLTLDSDVAILALDTPAVLTYYVRPVCFPQTSNSFLEEYQLATGNFGTVLGWGLTENGTLAAQLRMTELPVVSTSDCVDSYKDFFASMTRSTTFCAGYKNGTAVCNGDSGSGLYFRAVNKGNSRWYIQGLVSYGVPEEGSKKCSSVHYAVFTRVGRYGDWIVRTLSRENLI
jgi:dynein heavy chain